MFAHSALVEETERLHKFALRLTRNKADADDLLQSTCLRALERAHCFEDGTNLFGWVSKIMFNLFATDYRRRMKFETQFDPESYLEKESVAATQEVNADIANVKKAMVQLSADHRGVLVMICVNGMRYDEVSTLLRIPIGTVRSRLSRAREQILAILDKKEVRQPLYAIAGGF